MITDEAHSQSLLSPRAISLAAAGPLLSDSRGFVANPAALTGMKDWEFGAVAYLPTATTVGGFVFHGLTLGKKFLERHAAALQFSDGTALEFALPSAATIIGPEPTTVDSRVSYSERFSFGYAYNVAPDVSVGANLRVRQEQLTDTQYQLVETFIVRLPDAAYEVNTWSLDLALMWTPVPEMSVSLTGSNVMRSSDGVFPAGLQSFGLKMEEAIRLGVAYRLSPSFAIAVEGSTERTGAVGQEWKVVDNLVFRSGFYLSDLEMPFMYAFGAGFGWSYEFLKFDLSYLHFLDDATHSGTLNASGFDPSKISNLDLNPYTLPKVSMSVSAMFGNIRESLARIDGIEITAGVYPSSREVFAYRPLGKALVTNISSKPVQATAAFFVERLMDDPTESQPVFLGPGEQAEIPLAAVFNEELDDIREAVIRDATIYVRTTPGEAFDDRYQARLLVHGRNAWDGKAESLRYFVTPDDPAVLKYTRDVLLDKRQGLSDVSGEVGQFQKASILLETFAGKLLYVNDPKQSSDFVQYPSETLALSGGDCDDLTACFSALLNSVGISTAFVDVVPPGTPEKSHIYLLFDTALHSQYGSRISENPKRYIVRRNAKGDDTIWVPVETTVIMDGFEEAWRKGAEEYFDDVEIQLGLAKGWVRIVDVY